MIIGDRVVLKRITQESTPLIVKWRNNPKVQNNFIFQETFTEEMHNTWLKNKVATGEVVQFIVYIKDSSDAIGSVYLRDIDIHNKKAEFGIFIGEDNARGKGFGTEATRLICEYGFKELNLQKIILRVFAVNEAAIRTYEKAGFIQEENLKYQEHINGEIVDVIFMSKINN